VTSASWLQKLWEVLSAKQIGKLLVAPERRTAGGNRRAVAKRYRLPGLRRADRGLER
jgi:hypothetical protein